MTSISIPSKIIGGKKTEPYKVIIDNKIKDDINNFHYSINKLKINSKTITKEQIKLYYLQVLNIINKYNIIEIKDDLNIDDEHLITFYIKILITYLNKIVQTEEQLVNFHLNRIKKEFKVNDNLINSLNYLNYKLNDIDNKNVRGIFSHNDIQNKNWSELLVNNELPVFKNNSECINFTKELCKSNSNPKYKNLQHIFTTLIDWQQIEQIILPKIYEYNNKKDNIIVSYNKKTNFSSNMYLLDENISILNNIDKLFNLDFYKKIDLESTLNTFNYLYNHMRSGIYIMIRDSKVVIFAPFVNKNYTNTWSEHIHFDSSDGTKETYYKEKLNYYRKENIIEDIKEWWVNGNIIDNEYSTFNRNGVQYISDQYLMELRDFLDNVCKFRDIPDCEFFINKRDYPQIKKTLSEPYGFMFNKNDKNKDEDVPLTRNKYKYYTPILSFYTSDIFADIPLPCVEDWLLCSNNIYPKSCFHYKHTNNLKCNDNYTKEKLESLNVNWENKKDIAFFRGSATGGGTTVETNQRLNVAQLSYDLGENNGYIDAKLTSWNIRDKKLLDKPITYIKPNEFKFTASKDNFVEFTQQSKYKYLLYIEGHCAANRYSFLMRMDCVILKVDSTVIADNLWFFPLLKPYEDHIPIKSDLSNLIEVIEWCKNNDDKCKIIAEKAKQLYDKYISKESLFDYIELICNKINKNYTIIKKDYITKDNNNELNDLSELKDSIIRKINNNKNLICKNNNVNLKNIYKLSIEINNILHLLDNIKKSDLIYKDILINNSKSTNIYTKKIYTDLHTILNKTTDINLLYIEYFTKYENLYNNIINELYQLTDQI
jgi:hypothetical protein